MSNPLDTDAGSELFGSYEAELKLVQADLNQKLDQVAELTGEPRKSAVRSAERALEEAQELVHLISYGIHTMVYQYADFTLSSIKCASRNPTSPPQPARK